MSEFIGAVGEKAHTIQALRNCFTPSSNFSSSSNMYKFNICVIHNLPNYDRNQIARWVQEQHCQDVDLDTMRRMQFYLVNFLLCPEAEDEFDVEALVREVFHKTSEQKTILRLGKYRLVKDVV